MNTRPVGRPRVYGRPETTAQTAAQTNASEASTSPEDAAIAPETGQPRKRFGALTQKLAYPARNGYHRHWFIDEPGRIQLARECGYTHVRDAEGANVSQITGSGANGIGETCYLMEIPIEWYEQDRASEEAERKKLESQYLTGLVTNEPDDKRYSPNIYNPNGGIMRVETR